MFARLSKEQRLEATRELRFESVRHKAHKEKKEDLCFEKRANAPRASEAHELCPAGIRAAHVINHQHNYLSCSLGFSRLVGLTRLNVQLYIVRLA